MAPTMALFIVILVGQLNLAVSEVDSTVPHLIIEHQDLVIRWHYDYPDGWERAVTYWRYFNDTIEQPQAIILMLKDGDNTAQSTPAYKGKVDEVEGYNGGIVVKNIRMYESGTYLIQMDFKHRISYHDRIEVEVLKYNGTFDKYGFVIGSKTFKASAEYIFNEEGPVHVGVNATDRMPPGTITLAYCGRTRVCEESTSCYLHITLCQGSLTATIKHDGRDPTTLEMTLVAECPAQCSDGQCLYKGSEICDGKIDCLDGSDERNCPPIEECLKSTKGTEYRGVKSTTITGRTCLPWDSHKNSYTNDVNINPDAVYNVQNYCRNTGASGQQPWCYISNTGVHWEYCYIPMCEGTTMYEGRSRCSRTAAVSFAVVLDKDQPNRYPKSCRESYDRGNTKSGKQLLQTSAGGVFEVYCYFVNRRSGFVFPSRSAVDEIGSLDIAELSSDKNKVLILQRNDNGNTKEALVKPLPMFSSNGLTYLHNEWASFAAPLRLSNFGGKFLYLGFLDIVSYQQNRYHHLGFVSNGKRVTYGVCDKNPNNYFVFYANKNNAEFCEAGWSMGQSFLDSFKSSRCPEVMQSPDYWFTLEMHFGGCGMRYANSGCYDRKGYAIGLPFSL